MRHRRHRAPEHDLATTLAEQRRALAALAVLRSDRAPRALRLRIQLLSGRRAASHRRTIIPAAAAFATAALAAAFLALPAARPTLSVADAAALAVRPTVARVHEPPDGTVTLPHLTAAGLSFPYWGDRFGWRAVGFRRDNLDRRTLTTVIYVRAHQSVAYTIVSGPALTTPTAARSTLEGGTRLVALDRAGRHVVTWLRRGHTCVLSGAGVDEAELLALGSWRGGGAISY
jgi:hypothetical protein